MVCDKTCRVPCNIAHKRMALERRILRHTIHALKKAGWNLHAVHDGMERHSVESMAVALDVISSVDVSTVHVRHTDGRLSWFGVILGNGTDCVGGDYGNRIAPIIDAVWDHFSELGIDYER